MLKEKILVTIGWIVMLVAPVCWVANIVKLAGMGTLGGMGVLRVVGIFVPPLGVVLGVL